MKSPKYPMVGENFCVTALEGACFMGQGNSNPWQGPRKPITRGVSLWMLRGGSLGNEHFEAFPLSSN